MTIPANPLLDTRLTPGIVLVVMTMLVAAWMVWSVGKSRQPGASRKATVLAAGITVYLVVITVLTQMGTLDFGPLPPRPMLVGVLAIILAIGLATARTGRLILAGAGLAGVIGFQAFRIPVEFALHMLGDDGAIPMRMTWSGINFDVITGISAIPIAWLALKKRLPTMLLVAWNVMGIALLATIVTVAIMSTPTPLRVFEDGPANFIVNTFPHVWLPMFLVPAALMGHILVFRAICSTSNLPEPVAD